MIEQSKWIWHSNNLDKDIYCEFSDRFCFQGEKICLKISADSNYAVYVNGVYVASGQYPDYPYYKIYDVIDITSYCHAGENVFACVVWAYGQVKGHTNYYQGNPALRYELWADERLLTYSSAKTPSRVSKAYQSGLCKNFSSHIPLTFHYNLAAEDDWKDGELVDFSDSFVVEQETEMFPRPIKKTVVSGTPVASKRLDIKDHIIYDLCREETGYLCFSITSPCEQKIAIGFAEHIKYGYVEWLMSGDRHFGFEYTLKPGKNVFFNPMFRVGTRYLEVIAPEPVEVEYVSMYTSYYDLDKKEIPFTDELDRMIYDVCIHTLECCMHEHYEDCPCREQALYALDSRNQMLCGYYAFGEYAFPRSNLLLMSKDRRDDGLLTITVPRKVALTIPVFALFYIIETYEYVVHSKDTTIINDAYDKLNAIITTFINRMENGLVPSFTEAHQWNFYEWTDGMSGKLTRCDDYKFETPLNCVFVLALKAMHYMNEQVGKTDSYLTIADTVRQRIHEVFYDRERGAFINSTMDNKISELSNSFAILCEAVTGTEALEIAQKLMDRNSGYTEISLSMIGFKYDALIKLYGRKYLDYIFEDIRKRYQYMLDHGATTFWEYQDTDKRGEAASHCHGWSALPVYYYHFVVGNCDSIRKYYE